MHLEARGTFQMLTHGDKHYLVMNTEGTRIFITSYAEVNALDTVLTPLGNFSSMSKVRAAITAHAENQGKRKEII